MAILAAFQPTYGVGITETATTSSQSFVIDPATKRSGGGNKSLLVTNQGATNALYVKVGPGSQTATDADLCLMPGAQFIISKAETDDQVGLLAAAGTTAVHVIVGEGLCIG